MNQMRNSINNVNVKRLLTSQSLFWMSQSLFDIFMGVYIWKNTNSISSIAIYKLIFIVFHGLSFAIFGGLAKKGKLHLTRNLGIFGLILTYLALFFLRDEAISFIFYAAIFVGIFNGMYWVSYHIFRFDFTTKSNRGNFAGTEKAIRIVLDIFTPIVGGLIIVSDLFGLGYSNLFLVGSVLYLLVFIFADKRYKMHSTSKIHYRKTIKELYKDKNIVKSLNASLFGGIGRMGALAKVILPMYIFISVGDELTLGGWLSFFSIIAILSSMTIGRFVRYGHYRTLFNIGGLSTFGFMSLLIWFPSFFAYVIFGFFRGIFEVFIFIPKRVISDNLVHNIEDFSYHRVEFLVIREWFNVVIGRGLSYLMLFFIVDLNAYYLKFILGIMALAVLVEIYMISSIDPKSYDA